MAHEIKHGYKFSVCKMAGEPVSHVSPPRVFLTCGGSVLVEQGSDVLVGTPLSDDGGFIARSTVSGKVVSITPEGNGSVTVEIENDFRMERAEALPFGIRTGKSASELTCEDALAFIKEAGAADDLTGRPLWEIISEYHGKTDSLVINAVRCDKADMTEAAYAVFEPEKLIGGMKILMIALGIRSGTIAVSSCDNNNCDRLFDLAGKDRMIKISSLTAKYPQSDPYMIVYAMTGRELSPLHNISKSGIAVFSAGSAVAVYDAFSGGMAPNTTFLSIGTGSTAHLVEVVRGTPYSYLESELDLTGTAYINSIYSGRTADRDKALPDGTVTLYVVSETARKKTEFGCNKCSECISVCPMYLFPFEFAYSGARHAKASGALVCIECGLCEHVCPSGVRLTDRIRTLKNKIREGEANK